MQSHNPAAPDDAPLHRHRGHRFITERNFSKAQADLERAAARPEQTGVYRTPAE